jgi:hypothetical protein
VVLFTFFPPAKGWGKSKNAIVLKDFYLLASAFEKINLFVRSLPADGEGRVVKKLGIFQWS